MEDLKQIKIQINEVTIDKINPNRLYTIPEVAKVLRVNSQTVKNRISRKRLIPVPRRKFEHYKIFGSELRRYLRFSDEYEVEEF